MNAGRDTAGVAAPFVTGVAVIIYSCSLTTAHIQPVAVTSLLLCLVFTILLLADISNLERYVPRWLAVAGAMISCGIFIGSSGIIMSISGMTGAGALSRAALEFGSRLEEAVMSIPFSRPETGGILNALITGDRSGIPHEIKEAFRASGASHILALSGLHLGIIYAIIRKSLAFIGNTPAAKATRSVLTIALCCFYTLAVGAGPSIVRALLFIIISEAAMLTHRRSDLPSTLLTAMFIQLIINPLSIKEVGFQLSYAAVAGIAWIYPWLKSFWPGDTSNEGIMSRGMRWIWNSAAMSISCQIATGPLAYIYFRSFPLHFILTNLIALPLTGLIIPAALATLAASELGICPDIMVRATEMLVSALSEALQIISVM